MSSTGPRYMSGNNQSQPKGDNASAASPECIGEHFYNPYTFLPFPDKEHAPVRRKPTPASIDEIEKDRFTGVIRLKIRTCSPLLSCTAEPVDTKASHKKYQALTIGDDVIVPATGIRGSLRTMMTAIVGGTLGYMDRALWLCQGRDAVLGPATKKNRKPPESVFLAQVVEPGDEHSDGTIRLGETKLVLAASLQHIVRLTDFSVKTFDDLRPSQKGSVRNLWIDNPDEPKLCVAEKTEVCQWLVKLSGVPVGQNPRKKEGAFRATGPEIALPSDYWVAYSGRNRNGDFSELRKGYLVWLEPQTIAQAKVESAKDIMSLQWARWGRHGQSLETLMLAHHSHVLPDSMNRDGLVDEITDLFGHVPLEPRAAAAFAGRVRPSNAVFKHGAAALKTVTLAPLMRPHPGCVGFYHAFSIDGDDAADLDDISQNWPLRGYKVYRNTKERGNDAPWHFSVQGIYNGAERVDSDQQKCNKTCDLLDEGQVGELDLACYGLSKRELALLVLVCTSCDWRLGGGKPLGLGHCHVDSITVVDEFGKRCRIPEDWVEHIDDATWQRLDLYVSSQEPVDKLRYPRAVKPGGYSTRAGHVWFARHATPKQQNDPSESAKGMKTVWTEQGLKQKASNKEQIRAQVLPLIDDSDGKLYGYDCVASERKLADKRTMVSGIEACPVPKHVGTSREHKPNTGQNAESRRADRERRV